MKRGLIVLFMILFLVSFTSAETYYISPFGSDGNSGTSCNNAWKTFSYAQDSARAWCGDTLYLCDGTYNADEGGITVEPSCTSGNAFTIKAVNEGFAIVDGDYSRTPFEIDNKNYIIVEGIHFKESDSNVIDLDTADNLIFRRVTARDVYNPENNYHVWRITGVTNSLFEDCAGWGNGRNIVLIYKPSHHITLRRFYMQYHDKQSIHGPGCSQVYGSHNILYENVICTYDHEGTWDPEWYVSGVNIWDNNQNSAYNNRIYGAVTYDIDMPASNGASDFGVASKSHQITGNEIINSVGINNYRGIPFSGDSNFNIDKVTLVDHYYGISHDETYCPPTYTKESGYVTGATIKNSIIMDNTGYGLSLNIDSKCNDYLGTVAHTYNSYWNNNVNFDGTSQGIGEVININPNFNTAVYGKGAYLIRPDSLKGYGNGGGDIGAEVLYKYNNGILTNEPLWPWPMEDRIMSEAGVSVTWESGGGLWKTLDGIYEVSYCGDGTCNTANGENCSNCLDDCGACPLGNSYTILKTNSPLTIDGNLNEFADVNEITITNSEGNSATYKMLWDENNLYISAQGNDNQLGALVTERDGTGIWNDDSIELFFDTLNNGGTSLNSDDYKFFVNIRNVQNDARYDGSGYSWSTSLSSAVTTTGTLNSMDDTDTGYTIEIAIPWTNWGVAVPSDNSVWGFDVNMNDRRDDGTRIWDAWSQESGLNIPNEFGEIIFSSQTIGSICGASDSNSDGIVTISELIDYISQWKIGNVSIEDLIDAIGKWKSGC
jgi:hypothetical protein